MVSACPVAAAFHILIIVTVVDFLMPLEGSPGNLEIFQDYVAENFLNSR
jgi:hypothetical protein